MSHALLRRLDRLAEALDAVINPPRPPKLTITLVSRPTGPLDFDVISPEPRPGLLVVDFRARRPVPLPEDTQEPAWAPPEPPAIPEPLFEFEASPEPRRRPSEEELWSRVRLRP